MQILESETVRALARALSGAPVLVLPILLSGNPPTGRMLSVHHWRNLSCAQCSPMLSLPFALVLPGHPARSAHQILAHWLSSLQHTQDRQLSRLVSRLLPGAPLPFMLTAFRALAPHTAAGQGSTLAFAAFGKVNTSPGGLTCPGPLCICIQFLPTLRLLPVLCESVAAGSHCRWQMRCNCCISARLPTRFDAPMQAQPFL